MRVFISCSFDPSTKSMIELAKLIFKMYEIDAFVSGEAGPEPISESIKKNIRGSDFFLAILTKTHSAWVQNEIGIAYDAGVPIYAIKEEGLGVEGILQHITIYGSFDLKKPASIASAISTVAEKIVESGIEEEAPEIYKLFKNKRERIIYRIGMHTASNQMILLLMLKDLNPAYFFIYGQFFRKELERLKEQLRLLG